ncbi:MULTISPECIES: NADH:ubiquinone oxidoreductase [Roseobacteraceae]|uniref:NADH:ubiquinone oxidoreductase n=1 Tax=Roseobacteraceae TaxID=2854170 RepID=UPI0032EAD82D
MANATSGMSCPAKCWLSAAVVAVLFFVLLVAFDDVGVLWPLVLGAVVFVALGLAFRFLLCREGAAEPVTPAAATPASAAEPAPTPAPASEPAPASPATAAEPEVAAEVEDVPAADGDTAKPEGLSGPRGGKADDLKQIRGVGPKLEAMLNGMGFYHFDQIAGWGPAEVAWVDENLQGFKGRVTRDDWVSQAKTLASGGETAFSKRVDNGDVY